MEEGEANGADSDETEVWDEGEDKENRDEEGVDRDALDGANPIAIPFFLLFAEKEHRGYQNNKAKDKGHEGPDVFFVHFLFLS